ncbi:MAG TPA: hypothetical protein PKN80_03010, partial [bacterium]|nr:hypothetical protein [bacterium]
ARKASQLSVPDVTRRWVLPRPTGDTWLFEFPFTVGQTEVLGLMTFLRDYFASYSIEATGSFYTSDARFNAEKTERGSAYITGCNVSLAPFDLGVSQTVQLRAYPMSEFVFYGIQVEIRRENGERGDWQRLNRRFLDSIRKQFLVWRTLPPEVKDEYRQQGEKVIANGK